MEFKRRKHSRSRSVERKQKPKRGRSSSSSSNKSSGSSSLYSSSSHSQEKNRDEGKFKKHQSHPDVPLRDGLEPLKGEWNMKRQDFQERLQEREKHFEKNSQAPIITEGDYTSWKQKEEQFHLDQAILRSKIRINSNREKPIDFLVKLILVIEDKMPIPLEFMGKDYKQSYNIMEHLKSEELRTLIEEIETFQNIDRMNKRFQDYWRSQLALAKIQLDKKVKQEQVESDQPNLMGDDKLINDDELEKEAEEMIEGKNLLELQDLKDEIEQNLASDKSFATELQYWQGILKRIRIQMAKTVIENIYNSYVETNRSRIEEEIKKLEAEKQMEKQKGKEKKYYNPFTALRIDNLKNNGKAKSQAKNNEEQIEQSEIIAADDNEIRYNDGTLSPLIIPFEEAGYLNSIAVDPIENLQEMNQIKAEYLTKQLSKIKLEEEKRTQVGQEQKLTAIEKVQKTALNTRVRFDIDNMGFDNSSVKMYEEMKRQGLSTDEQEFTDIVSSNFDKTKYDWEDKYKPRKPRFFNSVITGYEWNKYNQTHYDVDNPPPKIVQGYKFNIFYPDLIDKTKTPQFYLENSDTAETLVIRFHAGPPYEDIAFKIINREWEMSERHDFRCVFDRGVLQLHFNFKKHRYRR